MAKAKKEIQVMNLVFDDWKKGGKSIYSTDEGAQLSMSDFHSGTTFTALIQFSKEQMEVLEKAWAQGINPIFRLSPRYCGFTAKEEAKNDVNTFLKGN
jgi:hypothetical protein